MKSPPIPHTAGHQDTRQPFFNKSGSESFFSAPEKPQPFFSTVIQPQLTVGPVNDTYEQEADRVAKQVVSGLATPAPPLAVQPQAEEEERLDRKPLVTPIQRKAGAGGTAVSPQLSAAIQREQGGGQALDGTTRTAMEGAFGTDFSGVRVHTGGTADRLNRSVQARAFTTGRDVFFRKGEYRPASTGGQHLLAHELTHVVQQGGGKARPSIQRAIGMEIESQNLKMWTGDGPYSAANAVPYGTKVLETTSGFDVEADDAGRVEFVTKAFPEEGDGLLRAVAAAAAFAKSAEQKTKAHKALNVNSFPRITTIGAGTLKTAQDPSVELFDFDDVYAKPQVTLGMPLDKFIAVLKQIGENTKEYPATAFHKVRPDKGLHHEKGGVEEYWDGGNGGSGGEMESTYQGILQGNHFNAKQSALFTLVLQYITEAYRSGLNKKSALSYADSRSKATDADLDDLFKRLNTKDSTRWNDGDSFPTPYPKAEHPLMARTNFRKMLEMAQFKPDDLKDLKGAIFMFADVDEGNHLYPFGYYSDTVKDEELYKPASIDKVESGPTVGQWLDSLFLPAPQDANPAKKSTIAEMGNRVAPHLPGTPEDRGLGAMGGKTEQININGQPLPAEAPIFEYRLLTGVYAPDEWLPLALAILNAARVVYGHKEAELPK